MRQHGLVHRTQFAFAALACLPLLLAGCGGSANRLDATLSSETIDRTIGRNDQFTLVLFRDGEVPSIELERNVFTIADQYPEFLGTAAVRAGESPELVERFGVNEIPSLLLFIDGIEVDRFVATRKQEGQQQPPSFDTVLQGWLHNAIVDSLAQQNGLKSSEPDEVASEQFDELIATSELPVLVDFTADWCGHCRRLAPQIALLRARYAGQLTVVKLDTDLEENYPISRKYAGKGLPTITIFHKGQTVASATGAVPAVQFREWVDTHLKSIETGQTSGGEVSEASTEVAGRAAAE